MVDAVSQRYQDHHNHDGHQRQDKSVFDKCLTFPVLVQSVQKPAHELKIAIFVFPSLRGCPFFLEIRIRAPPEVSLFFDPIFFIGSKKRDYERKSLPIKGV